MGWIKVCFGAEQWHIFSGQESESNLRLAPGSNSTSEAVIGIPLLSKWQFEVDTIFALEILQFSLRKRIQWCRVVYLPMFPVMQIPCGLAIAVIAVAPTDKASFVYSYVQTRLRGQYNGK